VSNLLHTSLALWLCDAIAICLHAAISTIRLFKLLFHVNETCICKQTTPASQPAIDHYSALSTFHNDKSTTFEKRAFRCSTPGVWNSLPKTVLSSDSVAVFKSRLKTFLLFSQTFSSLCSLTRCLAPANLKLRPYGAIQICLLLLSI